MFDKAWLPQHAALAKRALFCLSVTRPFPPPPAALPAVDCCTADVLLRQRPGPHGPLEVRVAIIGNVDSGKSTMVGVLTRSILDDGRGLARSKVRQAGWVGGWMGQRACSRAQRKGQCGSYFGVLLYSTRARKGCGNRARLCRTC